MKVSEKLNLVSQITDANGKIAHVHVKPLPYAVVEDNCVLLGNLFSQFFTLVGNIGAPRVAAMMLRKRIKTDRLASSLPEDAPTLIDDITRLATVIYQTESGYGALPLSTALERGVISEDAYRDVEGELVFFTVCSAIQRPDLIPGTVGRALTMYSAQLLSLSATAFRDSLPPLKTVTTSEETADDTEKETVKTSNQKGSFIPS